MRLRLGSILLVAALAAGCDDDSENTAADGGAGGAGGVGGAGGGGDDPSAFYDGEESAALGIADNQVRCVTCHSDDGEQVGFSGNTLQDIAYHSSFKGGMAPNLLGGANACITGWMGGVALTEADAEWLSLEAFIQSISDPAMTTPSPIEPEVLENEAAYETAYAGGDATAGEAMYEKACGTCHTPELRVNNRVSYSLEVLKAFSIGRIAQKVRTSGPPPSGTADATDTTPGPMPFFELKDLPVDDLKNVIAFIKAS
jgi:cytochrome c551/c552